MPSTCLARAKRLVLMAAVCGACAAQAAPVSLQLTGFSFAPGAGYGVDANESAATLLDVVFDDSGFGAQTLVMSAGDSFTVTLGSAQLREPNAQSGIVLAETDAIGLGATLSFGGALGAQAFTAGVTAALGSVSDTAVDLTISWAPLALDLGNGDWLDVALAPLEFTGMQTLPQTATLSLRHVGQETSAPALRVPEPGSMLLAGVALAALGLARRRRG